MFRGLRAVAKGESTIDFVGKARIWMTISAILMLVSIGGLTIRKLNLGLAFTGGTSLRAPLRTDATIPDIREALASVGVDAGIQIATDPVTRARQVLVQSEHLDPQTQLPAAQAKLVEVAGLSNANDVNVEDVGPKWGRQISNKALQGLIAFLVVVVLYISVRFEPKMAVASIIALFHDLLATAGLYAIVGFQVSPATVVALLTILGYSLYDTVVVFDKIRENTPTVGGPARTTYSEMVNRSVNLVFMRSINTSLTSLIPVSALLLVGAGLAGAEELKDLSLALFIGILTGSYSSVFLGAPLVARWKEREPRYRAMRSRAKPGVRGAPAFAAAGPATSPAAAPAAEPEVPPGGPSRPMSARPPLAARGRKRKRGKRR